MKPGHNDGTINVDHYKSHGWLIPVYSLIPHQKSLQIYYRAAAWIGYYRLLPDIIGYFPYSFKIHELPGGKNVWK